MLYGRLPNRYRRSIAQLKLHQELFQKVVNILKHTASYDALSVSKKEKEVYKYLLLSGKVPDGVSIEQ
ncbi:MAG: hypothetical protein AAFS12_14835, partial [Cyanobacteria bacterium J06632_19]